MCFFPANCVSTVGFLTSANGPVAACRFPAQIMLGSWSNHPSFAAAFDGEILKLHFLRKSPRIRAFSDPGLLLLVCLAR